MYREDDHRDGTSDDTPQKIKVHLAWAARDTKLPSVSRENNVRY